MHSPSQLWARYHAVPSAIPCPGWPDLRTTEDLRRHANVDQLHIRPAPTACQVNGKGRLSFPPRAAISGGAPLRYTGTDWPASQVMSRSCRALLRFFSGPASIVASEVRRLGCHIAARLSTRSRHDGYVDHRERSASSVLHRRGLGQLPALQGQGQTGCPSCPRRCAETR